MNNGTIKALQQKRKALQDELDAGLTLDLRLLHFGELASEGKGATPSEVADLVDAWASWRCLTWATRDAETRASDAMLTAAAMHLARRGER